MGIEDIFSGNVFEHIIQLTITFFGVFLGFILATGWDKSRYKRQQNEIKEKTIDSLVTELKENQIKIQSTPIILEQITNNTWKGNYTIMSTSAFDSVVNSGRFSVISDKLQSKISDIYIQIEYCNSTTKDIMGFRHSSGGLFNGTIEPIKPVITKRDETKSMILSQTPKLLEELNLERKMG